MAATLRQHFIVVSDPYAQQNGVSFGVIIWAFSPERQEIRKYWWGTGNCLIGRQCTQEYHDKRVKEMSRLLTEARQILAGELLAAEEISGTVKTVHADRNIVTVTRGFGKDAREQEFKIHAETRIVDGINELKEVVPLQDGLRSELVAPGASVRVATITDKDNSVKVREIRITGRPRPQK